MELNYGSTVALLVVYLSVVSAIWNGNTHLISNERSDRLKNHLGKAANEDLNCDETPQFALLTPENPQVNYTCFTTTYENMLMIKDTVLSANTSSNAAVQFIVIVESGMDKDYVLYSEILGPNTTSVTTYSACEVTYLATQVSVTHQAVLLSGSEATVMMQQTLETIFLALNISYAQTSLNCTGCAQFFSFVIQNQNGIPDQAYTITITVTSSSLEFPFSSMSIAGGSFCPDMQSTAIRTETFGPGITAASISFYGASYGSWFVSCSTIAANISYTIEVDGNCDMVSNWCFDTASSTSPSSSYEVPPEILYIVGGVSLGLSVIIALVIVIHYSRKRGQKGAARKNNNSFDYRPQDDEIRELVRDYDNS